MILHFKTTVIYGLLAFVIGFCFVSGAYVAHDMWRTVDDNSVIWLVNRASAGYVIALCVVLGFITARAIEYAVIRWWKTRKRTDRSLDD